jgi:peptidyl-prolyl cis-trans isomerase B (cyclophilin B)
MFGLTKELKKYNYTNDELAQFNYAKLTTSKGVLWIKLNTKDVANTVSNFVSLANDAFYDGLNFHRVIPGFMAQGGCPDGTGGGGPQWSIACETNANGQVHKKGSISMAHAGKDTGGSQFFICFVACLHLDGGHTVFGNIEDDDNESFSTLESIEQGDKIITIEILANRD